MGLGVIKISGVGCCDSLPNPDSHNFNIVKIEEGDIYDLVVVHYLDCTNYEGVKILIVEKGSVDMDIEELDPHFIEDGFIVARFQPSEIGTELARKFIGGCSDD